MIDKNVRQNPAESMRDLDELIEQEKRFRFDAFGPKDAIDLAKQMMENEKEWGRPVAFCIWLNGYTVFQYLPEGTGKLNETWLKKKIATVTTLGWSTMRFWAWQEKLGIRRVPELVPEADIVPCGGGFPIYVNGCGVVGVIAVSALGDQPEHDFIIDSLEKYTAG